MSESQGFRNYLTMSWAEMTNYIMELEIRVRNADSGSRLWKDELQAAKAAKLAAEARAAEHASEILSFADVAQRKALALAGLVEASNNVCSTWTEYEVALRMMQDRIQEMCLWLSRHSTPALSGPPAPDDISELDDIPF